jgi:hypothetical protein
VLKFLIDDQRPRSRVNNGVHRYLPDAVFGHIAPIDNLLISYIRQSDHFRYLSHFLLHAYNVSLSIRKAKLFFSIQTAHIQRQLQNFSFATAFIYMALYMRGALGYL